MLHGSVRILLVEDDDDLRDTLGALKVWGFHVDVAGDGELALRLAVGSRYHAVVCDLNLSGLDGLEVGRRLAAEHPRPYLIAHTGFGRAEDRERTEVAGFDAHIVKGDSIHALHLLLDELRTRPLD
jgi:DNA-binding response OmpR family regulator